MATVVLPVGSTISIRPGIMRSLDWFASTKAYWTAGILSYTIISLEIIWTRIFSVLFLYAFAFLVLSLAMLGSGLGAMTLRLFPRLSSPKAIPVWLLATVASALIAPFLVVSIDLDFSQVFLQWTMAARFVLVLLISSASYFSGGVSMALLFRSHHENLSRLYMVDLIGAAGGAVVAVLLMNWVGVPIAMILTLAPLILLVFSLGQIGTRLMTVVLAGVCLALIPGVQQNLLKNNGQSLPRVHSHWDAMGLINVYDAKTYRMVSMNKVSRASVIPFNGDVAAVQEQWFPLDMKPMIDRLGPDSSFVSIGAGGGSEVLMALKNGVSDIYAVEVNPYLNQMMSEGILADYSGKLYQRPNVHVVTEDARTFIRRHENRFDIISSVSSNTWSALGSGAFAMAENYLFTVEAFEDYLHALTPQGVFVVEHKVYGLRLVTQALAALERQGVADPNEHLVVLSLPIQQTTVMMVSKRPLSREQIHHSFAGLTPSAVPTMEESYPDPHPDANPYYGYVIDEGWKVVSPHAPIDLSPATDDRPFIAQLGLMKNVSWNIFKRHEVAEYNGFPVAKLIVISILLVVGIFVLPLTLIPYKRKGPKLTAQAWFYFFAIGCAFMCVEVVLLQTYSLFVGYSAYTMTVLLFALLVGAGLGSRWSHYFRKMTPFLMIAIWIILQVTLFRRLTYAMAGQTMIMRSLITFLLVAPLGFFMGMPFPKGSARIGALVDWGMAVNGSGSVVGAVGILLVSFTYGLSYALMVGAAMYIVAMVLLQGKTPWVTGDL